MNATTQVAAPFKEEPDYGISTPVAWCKGHRGALTVFDLRVTSASTSMSWRYKDFIGLGLRIFSVLAG